MSSLWTPDGERPVNRDETNPAPVAGGVEGGPDEPTEEELREYAEALREQLSNTPVGDVLANHCYGMFELAALHLSMNPPNLDEAKAAIDAVTAVVDVLGDRLGESTAVVRDAVTQIQMAYVQVSQGGTPAPATE